MPNEQPYLSHPGIKEQAVVAVMIRDPDSLHWKECLNFVKLCVHAKARNIPGDLHEDMIQEVMHKITNSLSRFRFECTLKSWVNIIIEHCVIDARRRLLNEERSHFPLADQSNESDREGESFARSEEKSAEDAFMISDEIRKGWEALLEYAKIHSNSIRDQHIIRMVVREGKTHAETAIAVGCSAPVVGYVVREAQRYAREKMGHKL
jgi:RNA polymerase sigma factor (sigma-70 family)